VSTRVATSFSLRIDGSSIAVVISWSERPAIVTFTIVAMSSSSTSSARPS
jgi:hypothetical protein